MPATKTKKPLEPVQISIDHLAYNRTLGQGVVDIIGVDNSSETYLLTAIRNGERLVGMRLLKLSDGAEHDVNTGTTAAWTCDCPDATYRPTRPGGCKHLAALR